MSKYVRLEHFTDGGDMEWHEHFFNHPHTVDGSYHSVCIIPRPFRVRWHVLKSNLIAVPNYW